MDIWEYCLVTLIPPEWDKLYVTYRTPVGVRREVHELRTSEEKAEFKKWQESQPSDFRMGGFRELTPVDFLRDELITNLLAAGWGIHSCVGSGTYILRRQHVKQS